ncbi:PucR family transcriptional regulator [Nocardioides campestrisoli]|uniref:PucR family transcriptional regulator n=1 Tax=Nocardioides campestrisoli TaxID=2736757 RepID=UPI001CD19931|nr:PucR family transcriptional regulator [Nocardioides campestrisoli]
MPAHSSDWTTHHGLDLSAQDVEIMRNRLPLVADAAVSAIIAEVPTYANALSGAMGETIRNAVQLALGGFIQLAARRSGGARPTAPSMETAYQLGRGEARSGRSMESLLAAYRVGARVSWSEMSAGLLADGVDAETLAKFAGLVFAYIDQLSASSVAGHSDESATTGRMRAQLREALGNALLRGDASDLLLRAAARAEWEPPESLTAVVLAEAHVRSALGSVAPETVAVADPTAEEHVVLLVPDATRAVLLRALSGVPAVVGPARPWQQARASWQRARRAVDLDIAVTDTEQHLAELVVHADPEALADLREQVLAPLADLGPAARDKLTDTLRTWLLHQGRREAVAEALVVHPQTVRYRVGQLREAYGDRLDDPEFVRAATIALG